MKLDKIFRTALEYKASDIYISTGAQPIVRINGDLIPIAEHTELTDETAQDYLLELLDEKNKKEFAEKKDCDFSIDLPGVARFRVNMFMQRKGISGIFRIIPAKVQTMAELGLPESLKKILTMHGGLVLVTGPAGSGKSSTLASIVNEINAQSGRHIITIEDPIEFVHENKKSIIEQREVGTHAESFQRALRASLREDPNVVLVGEMRDLETIALAITAAETGHLVLGTLHTSGAARTVDRIIDAFPADRQNQICTQLAEMLRAVVWQQLLKRADGTGRIAAFEILFCNTASANLIREGKTYQIPSIIETGIQDGMQTMQQSLEDLLEKGFIAEAEAKKYMPRGIGG